ncbi:hypothetical protein [Aliiroseovarius marinus]|uniref:hypothetical protein n=1 Tax=Aliiroseovarius marinus TaxID=2500159 RepID=UPI003D7E645A
MVGTTVSNPNLKTPLTKSIVIAALRSASAVLSQHEFRAKAYHTHVSKANEPFNIGFSTKRNLFNFWVGDLAEQLKAEVGIMDSIYGVADHIEKTKIELPLKLLQLEVEEIYEDALSDSANVTIRIKTDEIKSNPLWHGNDSAPFEDLTQSVLARYHASSSAFSYWVTLYQGFLDGKPLDWELQRRVALIPDKDWEKGPEHIAEKIEEVKAEYLAAQLPLAEDLEFDPDSGNFHTVPREMAKPDLLGATLSQVEDALDDVMENYSNGINERSVECRKLTRTFRKYGNDPQRIEMDFTTLHAGLTRQIINGELPPSEENLALQSALEEGAKAVRATHPEVAENRRILQEQNLRELTDDDKATLEEALPVLRAISDEALAEEWTQDIPALTNDSLLPVPDSAPRLPGADEATRIFGRAARMAVETKKSESIVQRIDGHSGYKALRIIQVLEWLVQLGMRILMYF